MAGIQAIEVEGESSLPMAYSRARRALSECARLDECKTWSDKAAALAVYAKQAKDEQLTNDAKRIRARAVDRMGELLNEIPPASGMRTDLELGGSASPRSQAATQAGLSPDQVKNALRVHNVPRDDFDRQVEGDHPPTIAELARQGTRRLADMTTMAASLYRHELPQELAEDRELAAWLIDHAGSGELPRLAELFENCHAVVVGNLLRGKCK